MPNGEKGGNIVRPDFKAFRPGKDRANTVPDHKRVVHRETLDNRRKKNRRERELDSLAEFFSRREKRIDGLPRLFEKDGAQKAHQEAQELIDEIQAYIAKNKEILQAYNTTLLTEIQIALFARSEDLRAAREKENYYEYVDQRFGAGEKKGLRKYDLELFVNTMRWTGRDIEQAVTNHIIADTT
jgi:hypothetical protein